MITPDDLRDELGSLGVKVSLRTLTDWRQKGLLPPLKKIGHGRGKGTRQGWLNSEVIDQAVVIHFLLERYSRTESALLSLWTAGYSVPPKAAKKIWLSSLDREFEKTQKHASKIGGPSIQFSRWIERTFRHRENISASNNVNPKSNELAFGMKKSTVKDFCIDVLRIAIDPGYEFEADSISSLIIDTFNIEPTNANYAEVDEVLETIKPTLLSVVPIENRRKAVELMSIQEIEFLRKTLRILHSIIRDWFELTFPESNKSQLAFISVLVMEFMGRFIAIVLFHLKGMGLVAPFVRSAKAICGFTESLSANDMIRIGQYRIKFSETGKEKRKKLESRLAKIWSNFSNEYPIQ